MNGEEIRGKTARLRLVTLCFVYSWS